jgi:hypothetical protein
MNRRQLFHALVLVAVLFATPNLLAGQGNSPEMRADPAGFSASPDGVATIDARSPVAVVGLTVAVAAEQPSPPEPTTGECLSVALPPGTPTPLDMTSGTPGTAEDAVSSAAETTPVPSGVKADQTAIDRVVAAEYDLARCLNAGEYLAAASIFTPRYMTAASGSTNPYDFVAHLEELPPIQLLAVDNVEVLDDGRIRDDIIYWLGDMLLHERDYWIEVDGTLYLDDIVNLSIDGTPTP